MMLTNGIFEADEGVTRTTALVSRLRVSGASPDGIRGYAYQSIKLVSIGKHVSGHLFCACLPAYQPPFRVGG